MRMRGTGIWKRPLAVLAALAVMAAMISSVPVLARAEDGAEAAVFDSGSGESSEVSSVPAEETETASADAAETEASLFSDENGSLLGAARDYNLVCFGNFKNHNADVWGKSAIGGAIDLSGGGGFQFGSRLNDNTEEYSLVWGATSLSELTSFGSVGTNSKGKALIYNGLDLDGVNFPFSNNKIERWTIADGLNEKVGFNFRDIEVYFQKKSKEISEFAKDHTNVQSKRDSWPKRLLLSPDSSSGEITSTYIFNVEANDLSKYQVIRFDGIPESSTIIINVTGGAKSEKVSIPGIEDPCDKTHLLWNLSEATAFSNYYSNSTYSIAGSVLAPNAAFTAAGNGGNFEGTMIVASFDGGNYGFEGHDYPFEGGNPLPGGDEEEPDFNGEIKVTKKINKDICYANGDPIFTFKLERLDEKGDDVAATEYRTVRFSKDNNEVSGPDEDGMVSQTATFSGLQDGDYRVSEEDALRYQLADKNGITGDSGAVTVNKDEKSAEIHLENTDEENSDENNNFRTDCDGGDNSDGDHPQNSAHVTFTNEKKDLGYFSHTDTVSNQIRIIFDDDNEETEGIIETEPETTEADAPAEDAAGTEQESAAPEETEQPGAAQEEPVNSEPPASAPDPPAESKPPAESPGGGEESEAPGPGGPGESGKQPPKETAAPPESGAEKESG